VCKSGQQNVHGVARQEAAKILCELDANPQDSIHFTWKFNNTAEVIDIPASHFTMDRYRSTTSYTPMTELDYGTLLCWGRNDIGVQKAPCVFHVIPAGMFPVRTTFCILVVSFMEYDLCLRFAHSCTLNSLRHCLPMLPPGLDWSCGHDLLSNLFLSLLGLYIKSKADLGGRAVYGVVAGIADPNRIGA